LESGWTAVEAEDRAAKTARSRGLSAGQKEEQIQEDVIDEALEPEWIGNDLCLWRRAGFLMGVSGDKLENRWIGGSPKQRIEMLAMERNAQSISDPANG